MASRVVTQLISDLSGEEITEGSGETIEFSYRGTKYVIDLTSNEASDFDTAMATWIEHATQQGRGRRSAAPSRAKATGGNGGDAKAIRQWARDQGIDVPERGRVPTEIRAQYEAAN